VLFALRTERIENPSSALADNPSLPAITINWLLPAAFQRLSDLPSNHGPSDEPQISAALHGTSTVQLAFDVHC
jgi:hypothetical protein